MSQDTGDEKKLDYGKPPIALVPSSGVIEIAKVLAFGARKYSPNGWRITPLEWSRLISAADRHMLAFKNGEDNAADSGLSHLAHAACNLFFLMEYMETHPENDDRWKEPPHDQ